MAGYGNEPAIGDAAWGTAEMKAALTEGATEPQPEPNKPKPTPNGWVEARPYKYDEYGKDGNHEWDSNAKVYEWDGETGDVGPEYPELELELFGAPEARVSHGIDFSK
jgi:ATP-dependent RNA helicase DDX3X